MKGLEFLREKYANLSKSSEVERAAKRTKVRTKEEFPQTSAEDAEDRIQNYLDRLTEVLGRKDPHERKRGLDALKAILYEKYILKPEEIPESFFESIKRKHRAGGYGDIEVSDDYRRELTLSMVSDQKQSLDNWIDYLSSDDAKYPDWLKYYAFRSILRMGMYDPSNKSFSKDRIGTVAPFPDLNRQALSVVLDAFESQSKGEPPAFGRDITGNTQAKFLEFLEKKNFAKLYALAIEEFKPISEELLKITEGKWVTYEKGSDHVPLVASIANYGTGWCLRGEGSAQRYLVRDNNDLLIYYSNDAQGEARVPRVVIVVNAKNEITEVRGVAPEENLDQYIGTVVREKLDEHPDGRKYEKKSKDMDSLTGIEKKVRAKEELNREDLTFLYEIDDSIEGFGYQKDPRIKELRTLRNPKEDVNIIFDCTSEQIAYGPKEVNEHTKVYIGPLFPGIFHKTIEHMYTSFSEGKIQKYYISVGGKNESEIRSELKEKNIYMIDFADVLLKKIEYPKHPEPVGLVRLTVRDLGFGKGATTDQIYKRAHEYGLELCPATVGPQLRLEYSGSDWMYIAMKQDSTDDPIDLFYLDHDNSKLKLFASRTRPSSRWSPDSLFIFSLTKRPG